MKWQEPYLNSFLDLSRSEINSTFGMISAALKIFPDMPIRICLMHFLRDLGKDPLMDMHTALGIMINRQGIKSSMKRLLRNIPLYEQKTLEEIEAGFCSDPVRMEFMALRMILEKPVNMNCSSGYGFPFSMRHLNFFMACDEAMNKLSELIPGLEDEKTKEMAGEISGYLSRITGNSTIVGNAVRLKDVNSMIFQKIRKGFMIPDNGNLSTDEYNPIRDDPIVHEKCTIIFGELGVFLNMNIQNHIFTAAKLAIERYRKREEMLFSQNSEGTIPRTNNNMEIFFRKVRRNKRKRCGNRATGNILTQSGEKLALFQNMGNEKYKEIVFGSTDISSVFAKHRKQLKKNGMTRKKIIQLVDKGTEMIIQKKLYNTPYNDETMELAWKARDELQKHQESL